MSFTSTALSVRIADWISGRRTPEHGDVLLDRKRVYILPTTAGTVFGAAMVVLLVGSINYGLQLGFMLTFLVTSMAVVGLHHTHRNLARIVARGQGAENVFAGDLVSYELTLTNPTAEARYALRVTLLLPMQRRAEKRAKMGPPTTLADVPANSMQTVRIGMGTRRRGRRPCPRIRIETRFPFGLFQAWAYVRPALVAIVYPAPEVDAPPLPVPTGGNLTGVGMAASGDDLAGVRPYQPGDPLKMVAWRLAARSRSSQSSCSKRPAAANWNWTTSRPGRNSTSKRVCRAWPPGSCRRKHSRCATRCSCPDSTSASDMAPSTASAA